MGRAYVDVDSYASGHPGNCNCSSFRTGSVLVLVASILAIPTAWGFFVGSLMMIIGSILGLTWTPLVAKTSEHRELASKIKL